MQSEVHLPLLDHVRIASPCPVKWEDMTGDDTTRHCAQCNLSVFNLSNMSRDEAEAVLQSKLNNPDKRLCAGFFRRADGTILLKDCPVGLRAAKIRIVNIAGRIAAVLGFLAIGGSVAADSQREIRRVGRWPLGMRDAQPFKSVAAWLNPRPVIPPGSFTLGFIPPPRPAAPIVPTAAPSAPTPNS